MRQQQLRYLRTAQFADCVVQRSVDFMLPAPFPLLAAAICSSSNSTAGVLLALLLGASLQDAHMLA